MLAILVTGSRKWKHYDIVETAIHVELEDQEGDQVVLIHGGANGADDAADEACGHLNLCALPFPAQWQKHGKAAGPIRNDVMVDVLQGFRACGYRCVVLAFPCEDSVGTHHCIAAARRYGFDVKVFSPGAASGEP